INLTAGLEARGVNILRTTLKAIDRADDRHKFEELLEELNRTRPAGKTVTDKSEVVATAQNIGFPVLVTPSYITRGSKRELVYDKEELENYLTKIDTINPDKPLLIDEYVTGIEVDVGAVSDGETTIGPGSMEHIERAGVHSGDSLAVYPPQRMSEVVKQKSRAATANTATETNGMCLLTTHCRIHGENAYVSELTPPASRTPPFLSSVTAVPMANIATKCIPGAPLADKGSTTAI